MFTSIYFLLFLVITLFFYLCFRVKWRSYILYAASLVFCAYISREALITVLAVTLSSYFAGRVLEVANSKKRKEISVLLLAVIIAGYLFLFLKYPSVGLSFYLFQAIGYLADIYKEKGRAEKNIVYLGLYYAFFAKFISGPIEKAEDFIPQLKKLPEVKLWNRGRLSAALTYLLWGGFMKMVVADRLAVPVGMIFDTPQSFDTLFLLLGALLYSFQIYCDFAGYSYLVIGLALIFGIRLTFNFNSPYMAESISEFWHRWHMSLSRWLRENIYIPLGGNRKGFVRKCMNTIVVFLVCGLWHGRNFQFIFWGLWHGFLMTVDTLHQTYGKKSLPPAVGRLLTFLAVTFGWIFFGVDRFMTGFYYVKTMCTAGIRWSEIGKTFQLLRLGGIEGCIILFGILLVVFVDALCKRTGEHLPDLIQHRKNHVRYLIFYLLFIAIFIFGIYGPGYHAEDFIYMQF